MIELSKGFCSIFPDDLSQPAESFNVFIFGSRDLVYAGLTLPRDKAVFGYYKADRSAFRSLCIVFKMRLASSSYA